MARTESRSQRHKGAGMPCCSYAWAWGHPCCHLVLTLYTALWTGLGLRPCLRLSLHYHAILQGTTSYLLLGPALCLCSPLPPCVSGSWLHPCGFLVDWSPVRYLGYVKQSSCLPHLTALCCPLHCSFSSASPIPSLTGSMSCPQKSLSSSGLLVTPTLAS